MTRPVALVTGAAGQDGSYLTERLVADGYAVHAVVRSPVVATDGVSIHEVDLTDHDGLRRLVLGTAPDEVYNLGGISSVAQSWSEPVRTAEVSGVAVLAILQACLELQQSLGRPVRLLQASSAEIFGEPTDSPQTEATPIRPVSPYGAAKALAHHAVHVYRAHGLHASTAILYNHESPRRPTTFVTRKITRTVASIAAGSSDSLRLGNLDARRDWGWAPDYVDAMVRAIRHDRSDDYIVATGHAHSVRDFVAIAFAHVGIDDWERHVVVDPGLFRPADPTLLVGDPGHARRTLGWTTSHDFQALVQAMVDHDVALLADA
ncbi:MAG: GDP-mannose 4,6-dehydratase [Dermatophilaceae bacterium]